MKHYLAFIILVLPLVTSSSLRKEHGVPLNWQHPQVDADAQPIEMKGNLRDLSSKSSKTEKDAGNSDEVGASKSSKTDGIPDEAGGTTSAKASKSGKTSKTTCIGDPPSGCTQGSDLCIRYSNACEAGTWICKATPVACAQGTSCDTGDGFCKASGEILKNAFQVKGSISQFILDRYKPEFYDMIAKDLEGRNIESGSVTFETDDDISDEEWYGFNSEGGSFSLSGVYMPDSEAYDDTTIRAYTKDGSYTETQVDSVTGYFSIGVTNVPPGRTPIILVVSSSTSTENNVRVRNLEESNGFSVPCVIYGVNNEACPPTLDLELTWDGSTSDVDLHVVEKGNDNYTYVYFGNKQGEYGYLNIDDVDGLGPEHYYANNIDKETMGLTFWVDMYSFNNDSVVPWKVVAKQQGTVANTWYGTFNEDTNVSSSNEYSITIPPSTCLQCLSSYSSRSRRLSSCCPPKQYEDEGSFFCGLFGWCGDELQSYKVWENLNSHTNPTKQEVIGLVYIVFGHRSSVPAHNRGFYDLGMSRISNTGNCLEKMWEFLLGVYCEEEKLEGALEGILDASNIISKVQLIGGIASSADAASYIGTFSDAMYSEISGPHLEGVTKNLKSYTADRAFLVEFSGDKIGDC